MAQETLTLSLTKSDGTVLFEETIVVSTSTSVTVEAGNSTT